MDADHVTAWSKGGSTDVSNCQMLCKTHNLSLIHIFLGYPPEDVQGFMENKAARHKLAGCWKVYGDVDAAQQTFARYKKCTRVYLDQWRRGATLERLTVSS